MQHYTLLLSLFLGPADHLTLYLPLQCDCCLPFRPVYRWCLSFNSSDLQIKVMSTVLGMSFTILLISPVPYWEPYDIRGLQEMLTLFIKNPITAQFYLTCS
ncbi:hypothetical protein GDO86_002847 [Hymenochirus boettgeri]|uniref:Uncharacterized protein n=1 Tax=Hymenochirus boettgeri TaxID=247094 RepID=A0A8T2JYU0_9PIPI|nr:hypothetical protein GDO86_002847 [Hymenochirus boettgeri]